MKFAFSKTMTELAKKDQRIIFLTGDLGFQLFDEFEKLFGSKYINVGVAEAQMMCAAAGLAHVGYRPITYSIASFATARCYEQIKVSIAYPSLPVIIVGAGGGYAYGSSGPTHHAGDDISLMRSLPGMAVVAPGDSEECAQLLPQVLKLEGPAYFRIGRGKEPSYKAIEPAVLGKGRLLAEGRHVAVISTGEVAYEVCEALKILSDKNISPLAYQFHTVSPLDTELLDKIAVKASAIVVVDEHLATGGLGSAIRDWGFESQKKNLDIKILSVPNEFVLGSPSQGEVRKRYGFDARSIVGFVEKLWLDQRKAMLV